MNPLVKILRPAVAGLSLLFGSALAAANLYEIPLTDIDGAATRLAPYKGKVLLVVNVASKCGLTPQYKALETVYQTHREAGFVVLGFPCNQFAGQEPGTNAEIKEFCSSKYSVTFPLFDKLDVNGEHRHPLYVALAGPGSPFPGDIGWNFGKFLVNREGKVIARFSPKTHVESPEIMGAIQAALK